jgi:hypothetical protein
MIERTADGQGAVVGCLLDTTDYRVPAGKVRKVAKYDSL